MSQKKSQKKKKVSTKTSHSKIYIGIDPGKSGAIASIDNLDMRAWNCPDDAIDMNSLILLIIGWHAADALHVLMEKVWARPNNASRAAFNYGVNYGQWFGVLAGFEIEPELILPAHWMKFYDMKKGMEYQERKKWLKATAQELYPNIKVTLINADAILIAHYLKERDVH